MNTKTSITSGSVALIVACAVIGGGLLASSMPVYADKSDKPIVIVVGPVTKTPANPPKKLMDR